MNQTYDIMENREESGQRLRFREKYEAPSCEAVLVEPLQVLCLSGNHEGFEEDEYSWEFSRMA